MTINAQSIQPGLLVSLKTSIRGNTTYRKLDLGVTRSDNGAELAKWEMERTVISPDEMERAKKVRSKVTSLIRSVCTVSNFGLLCPESKASELEQAVKVAREVMREFNGAATYTQVNAFAIAGRIAADDAEAIRALNSEVRDLLDDMRVGVKSLDADAIREAANKARQLGNMLSPEAEKRVQEAVTMARKAARKIVKAGELAAQAIDDETVRQLTDMRLAFLDLDDMQPMERVSVAEGVAVDLQPVTLKPMWPRNSDAPELDMGGE